MRLFDTEGSRDGLQALDEDVAAWVERTRRSA